MSLRRIFGRNIFRHAFPQPKNKKSCSFNFISPISHLLNTDIGYRTPIEIVQKDKRQHWTKFEAESRFICYNRAPVQTFIQVTWNLIMARTKKTRATAAKAEKKDDDKVVDKDVKDNVKEKKGKAKPAKKDTVNKAEEKATPKNAKGRKRQAKDDDDAEAPKPKLAKVSSISDSLGETDFSLSSKSSSDKDANFKISSWNINGVRAWLAKDGPSYLKSESPDVLCVQELKCDISKIPSELSVDGYSTHWLSGDTEGYSGVGMYFKKKPLAITEGIGIKKHDNEGRVLTAEFESFYLVNTYIPNSGRGLVRHKYRTKEWDTDFLDYLKTLDKKKPVIWCGDLNVAHQKIDIKNANGNKKNAGFTQEERDNFSAVLEAGFVDSFRHLYPEQEHAYSFWAYFMNARAKNVGWRLDYFVMSERLKDNLCDSVIRSKVMGSDHCPIVLELAL